MDNLSPFERNVWLLLDLIDLKSQLNWRPFSRKYALEACVDSLRISLNSVRHTLTASQPSQLLLELAIHAIHGYGGDGGDGGYSIAMVIDFGRVQLRDGAYGDGLAIWIADLLVETVRRAASPDQDVWKQVIANLEAAVERVDQLDTLLKRSEVLADQPVTEVALMELIDGVRLFGPSLARDHLLEAFLKREIMGVVESGTAPQQWQMPRIRTVLLGVREQLTGVHTALMDGMHQQEAQLYAGSGAHAYESIA